MKKLAAAVALSLLPLAFAAQAEITATDVVMFYKLLFFHKV